VSALRVSFKSPAHLRSRAAVSTDCEVVACCSAAMKALSTCAFADEPPSDFPPASTGRAVASEATR
jgi:hypothetical protein